MRMNKRVELPLLEPIYKTYHYQAPGTAIAVNNPSVKYWYLSGNVDLTCKRDFLKGYSSPLITIMDSAWSNNPHIEKNTVPMHILGGQINSVIKEMLNNGYYVSFGSVDDYYVEGKSWYKERHFSHDGLICGYDSDDKTYCIYAYDKDWIYQKFWTPQKAFNAGRRAMEEKGEFGNLCAIKMKNSSIGFAPETACVKLRAYIDADFKKYPITGEGFVLGSVVHEYIAYYLEKLYKNRIPYEKIDRRVFRVIWEQKKAMLGRIEMLEYLLDIKKDYSKKYPAIVKEADVLRMLYASHILKRRDELLPVIKKRLLEMMKNELEILSGLTEEVERELKYEIMEIYKK